MIVIMGSEKRTKLKINSQNIITMVIASAKTLSPKNKSVCFMNACGFRLRATSMSVLR